MNAQATTTNATLATARAIDALRDEATSAILARDKYSYGYAANLIERGDAETLKGLLYNIDTAPRDEILDHINPQHWAALGFTASRPAEAAHLYSYQFGPLADWIDATTAGNAPSAEAAQAAEALRQAEPKLYDEMIAEAIAAHDESDHDEDDDDQIAEAVTQARAKVEALHKQGLAQAGPAALAQALEHEHGELGKAQQENEQAIERLRRELAAAEQRQAQISDDIAGIEFQLGELNA